MDPSFHRRYHDLHLIREHVAFRVLSARRSHDDSRCVLVARGRTENPEASRAALARFAAAHRLVDHPQVPRTSAELEVSGHPVVELDCPGICDGLEVFRRFAAGRVRMPYEAADGFIVGLRTAMQGAHRATDPWRAGPLCLGRMSGANVLFGPDGRSYLIGFGHNVCVDDERGVADPERPFFQAPELGFGGAPSPSGDYVALLAYMRSGVHLVDKSDALARVVRGLATNADAALLELLVWVESRVMSSMPQQRATIDEAVVTAERIRRVLGSSVDPDAFARLVARSVRDARLEPETPRTTRGPLLTVGPSGEWVRFDDDEVVRLRSAMRRILLVLVERRLLGAIDPVRTVELGEAGWPGEEPEYESGRNRVYVTMTRLRKVLPDDAIQRFDDGYRLDPAITVHRVS